MAEWMEDNHALAEISKSSRNPFLPSSNRFPIPSEIQEDGLSGKKPKIWSWYKQLYSLNGIRLFLYVHVLSCWPEQHTNVTKGNLYTMEWFLITWHNSKPIGRRGLYCGEQACFFRGLGWDGDGGGGKERTSPPRLNLSRHWRVNKRQEGHGWCRHARTFYLTPFPRRPLTLSALFTFSHKIKEGDWLQETLGAKSLHEPFGVSHNLPC